MIKRYTIKGLVQGIGYRPFVAKLADELNIDGYVRNTGGIVTVVACGETELLTQFQQRLSSDVPECGFVTSIEEEELIGISITPGFRIIESNQDIKENLPLIPADIATCEKCKQELLDSKNRRYQHPFISCTVCGPRYSIIEKLPYDRDTITMADFDMCPECKSEYIGRNDRRRHAQTIACKSCGPHLEFFRIRNKNTDNVTVCGNVDNIVDTYNEKGFMEVENAVQHLKNGGILAIKDIGGYHLACSPFDGKVVAALRRLKHREEKAFAVMFDSLEQIRTYCYVDVKEEELLESSARPIVLVRRKENVEPKSISKEVYHTSPDIGAMLPCNPVQMMLIKQCGPLIMTSGNASGDVLETDDGRMKEWLELRVETCDFDDTIIAMLSHNRRILRPMDDSVMKVVKGRQQFIRRGRGHVPNPVSVDIEGEIFAAGGDLKSSFCYIKNGLAYVSQYLGDMESVSCQKFYKKEQEAMKRIFGFKPDKVATDLHPLYFSKRFGDGVADSCNLQINRIQHHKAHVAAVIAEHHLKGQVLGFAFDGTGCGDDDTIWGSEVFIWDGKASMNRVSHLKAVKLIGGDEGAKNCDIMLAAILHNNGLDCISTHENQSIINAAIDNNINTVISTSMGRIFDAVAAMLDICHYNSYEGQAPTELENAAAETSEAMNLKIGIDGDTRSLFKDIDAAMKGGVPTSQIARGFIYAVADYVVETAKGQTIKQIVLSGGTFLNRILTERVIEELEKTGFEVYMSEQLPPGDGGICLGQAFLMANTDINNS